MNDTYKVPVIAGSSPNCGFALTGRHSVEGRNIFIPSSEKAGMLSFMIWISIIAISALTPNAVR